MDYLILAFIGFVAALTPGPDIFFVIRNGLCYGLKNALLAVAGILTGNIVYLFLVYIGLGVIGQNPYFQLIVGILGAVYLFRISIAVFNEKVKLDKSCEIQKGTYLQGLILNLSNPKAMIFFAVIVTPFLGKNIFLSFLGLYLGIASAFLFAAFLTSKLNLEEKILNIFNKIASVIFFVFAVKLLFVAFEAIKTITG